MEPSDLYEYSVEWNDEDQCFFGTVQEFSSLSAWANTAEDALCEIKSLVEFVLEDMKKTGERPPMPIAKSV